MLLHRCHPWPPPYEQGFLIEFVKAVKPNNRAEAVAATATAAVALAAAGAGLAFRRESKRKANPTGDNEPDKNQKTNTTDTNTQTKKSQNKVLSGLCCSVQIREGGYKIFVHRQPFSDLCHNPSTLEIASVPSV